MWESVRYGNQKLLHYRQGNVSAGPKQSLTVKPVTIQVFRHEHCTRDGQVHITTTLNIVLMYYAFIYFFNVSLYFNVILKKYILLRTGSLHISDKNSRNGEI